MNLNEIKVLVVDDSTKHGGAIKEGLLLLEKNGDKLNESNIFILESDKIDNYDKVAEVIENKNIDTIFVDLHLGKNIEQGVYVITNFINSSNNSLKYIVKYCISGVIGQEKLFSSHPETLQYIAGFIEKPEESYIAGESSANVELSEEYSKIFKSYKLDETLPLLCDLSKAIIEGLNVSEKLERYNTVNKQNFEQIINHLDAIRNISSAILLALPKITDRKKADKLINEFKENDFLKDILGENMPKEGNMLYEFLKEKIGELAEKEGKDIIKYLYGTGLKYLSDVVKIEEDDTKIEIIAKYSSFFLEKAYSVKKMII